MALKYLDGGRITGLSTDVKPTDIPTGSSFVETDSGTTLVYNGTRWVQESFDSINSALGYGDGITQKQHFVEWFCGKQIEDDRWTYTLFNGTGAGAMADSIDGGFTMNSTATGGTSESILTFNNINQYSHMGACFICVAKSTAVGNALSSMETRGGFKLANSNIFGSGQHAGFKTNTGNVNFSAYTASASGTNATDTYVYHDVNPHVWKGELKPSSFELTLDGLNVTTNTTYLPTVTLQPYMYHYGFQANAGSNTSTFNYYEAWNR